MSLVVRGERNTRALKGSQSALEERGLGLLITEINQSVNVCPDVKTGTHAIDRFFYKTSITINSSDYVLMGRNDVHNDSAQCAYMSWKEYRAKQQVFQLTLSSVLNLDKGRRDHTKTPSASSKALRKPRPTSLHISG